MPKLTRWFIKTSLVYLVFSLLLSVLLLGWKSLSVSFPLSSLWPVYFHTFMVGWVAQLIFGVAYWMFPKYSPDKPRGSEKVGWATYLFLNLGLLLRIIGEPMSSLFAPGWGWLLLFSAVFQWFSSLLFVLNTWKRVHR